MALAKANPSAQRRSKSQVRLQESIRSAIIFGHADGDGHLAAVQTREWLGQRGISATTVVSSETRNYLFWGRLEKFDLANFDLIVFVDIAFRFRDPKHSLDRLLEVSDRQLDKQFIAIDHHPFVHPQSRRDNVRLVDVDDPYNCCLGPPNPELMEVAAICDGSPTTVTPTLKLEKRALGVKRAAADIDGVAGNRLLRLIEERRWDFFEALADEDRELHRSARGIRRRSNDASPLLEYARNCLTSRRPR